MAFSALFAKASAASATLADLVDDKEGERIKLGNENALEADLDNAAIKAPWREDGNTIPRESRQRE